MKYSLLLVFVFFGIVVYAGINFSTGITGRTEKNGFGCNCHSPQRDLSVMVQIEGPDTLYKGETGNYTLSLSGGPAVAGGFNVASLLGNLNVVDGTAKLVLSEITHTSPKMFSGNTVINWEFTLQARDSVYTDTLYSVANSVNADGSANSNDKWNFGNKFVVNVIDQPSSVDDDILTVNSFTLNQNYPNPFNPSTKISWQSKVGSYQILTVYDAIGTEVATIVNEYKEAGRYEIDFNAANLSSGVYYYKLQAGSFIETKKMLLLR